MKYSEAKRGRVFILRLEGGEVIHKELELFAGKLGIKAASVSIVGGIDKDSILVVGPEKSHDKILFQWSTFLRKHMNVPEPEQFFRIHQGNRFCTFILQPVEKRIQLQDVCAGG